MNERFHMCCPYQQRLCVDLMLGLQRKGRPHVLPSYLILRVLAFLPCAVDDSVWLLQCKNTAKMQDRTLRQIKVDQMLEGFNLEKLG